MVLHMMFGIPFFALKISLNGELNFSLLFLSRKTDHEMRVQKRHPSEVKFMNRKVSKTFTLELGVSFIVFLHLRFSVFFSAIQNPLRSLSQRRLCENLGGTSWEVHLLFVSVSGQILWICLVSQVHKSYKLTNIACIKEGNAHSYLT